MPTPDEIAKAVWAPPNYRIPDPANADGAHPNFILRAARADAAAALKILREMAVTGRTLTDGDIDRIIAEQAESFGLIERDI